MACGAGTPAPTPLPGTAFPDGRYTLRITVLPGFANCNSRWDHEVFTTRQVTLRVVREGAEWVARTEFTHHGDVVLRFREASAGSGTLAGSVAGTGIMAQGIDGDIALGIRFSSSDVPPAQVAGSALPTRPVATGRLSGTIEFIDAFRTPLACPAVDWMLTPNLF